MTLYTLATYTNGEVHENDVHVSKQADIKEVMKIQSREAVEYAETLDMQIATLTFVLRPD